MRYELFLPSNEERFNNGMVCILDCLNSLSKHVLENYGQFRNGVSAAATIILN